MKCGIITFHRAVNYGAVLQAYALRQFIDSNYGVSCELIDYRCKSIEDMYTVKRNIANPKTVIKSIISGRKRKKFESFIYKNIAISQSLDKTDLADVSDNYDVIITGSDQVWGKSRVGKDETYFLDFVSNGEKKASYAASMGSGNIDDEYVERYRYLLQDFNFISLREHEAAATISKLLNRETSVSIDPTLLLKRDEWEKVASGKFKNKKYLLIYTLTESKSIIEHAKKVAKQYGLQIYNISDSYHSVKGIKNLRYLSPEDWVDAFLNASYVITNSFHGTAFSVNFGVDFNTEVSKGLEKRGTRITDLLEILNLEDRLLNASCVSGTINFSTVHSILDVQRQNSEAYLAKVLSTNFER